MNRFRRVRELERISTEMAEKEERLWFFENEDQIDLDIERIETEAARKGPTRVHKSNARDADANYIPPEVGNRNRN